MAPTLLRRVAGPKNLNRAWEAIRHRALSKGIDDQTIDDFRKDLAANLRQIRGELLSHQYRFHKLRGHPIAKNNGKIRPLKIPAVRDRVVQKAIQLIIEPYLNKIYKIDNPVSFAYIKNKSVIDAVKRVRDLYGQGFRWVYISDIEDFFGSIQPSHLCDTYILPVLPDSSINGLIKSAISTEIGNLDSMKELGYEDAFVTAKVGIAQGGILSPLFANVYLHELDREMQRLNLNMVRYADDFVVMCIDQEQAEAAHTLSKELLEIKLKLRIHDLNSKKCKIQRFSRLDFLGVHFDGSKIFPGFEAHQKMVKILKEYAAQPPNLPLIDNLNYLRNRSMSWAATYFYTEINRSHYQALDNHLADAIAGVICKLGFKVNRKTLSPNQLSRIGIPTFTQSLQIMMRRKKDQLI